MLSSLPRPVFLTEIFESTGMVDRIEFMCSPDVNKVVANPNPKVVFYICVLQT